MAKSRGFIYDRPPKTENQIKLGKFNTIYKQTLFL